MMGELRMKQLTKQEEKIILDLINGQLDDLQRSGIDKGYYKTTLTRIKGKLTEVRIGELR